jgi:hypothetical protein
MDGDPAEICRVYLNLKFSKNITTGSGLFVMHIVLPD